MWKLFNAYTGLILFLCVGKAFVVWRPAPVDGFAEKAGL